MKTHPAPFQHWLSSANQIPIRLTLPHFYYGADRTAGTSDAEFWDHLRATDPHFGFPRERQEWVHYCEALATRDGVDSDLPSRASSVVEVLRSLGIRRLFSVGVGGAAFEFYLHRLAPDIRLVCSEFSRHNVEAVARVFTECEAVVPFDLAKDDWGPWGNGDGTLCLLWRVDPHLDDQQWRTAFRRAHDGGVQYILFGVGGALTFRRLARRAVSWLRKPMGRGARTRVGWVRSDPVFPTLWAPWFRTSSRQSFSGVSTFLLERRP